MSRRLVAAFVLVLAACSARSVIRTVPQTPSFGSTPGSTSEPFTAPRVVLERNSTLFAGSQRISVTGFYPSRRRATEPPVSVSASTGWALAYTTARPGWYVLSTSGANSFALPAPARVPVWGPSEQIAFVEDGDLHVLAQPGGSDRVILKQQPVGCCQTLAWSGPTIAMEVLDRSIAREQIWIVASDGTGLRKVYEGASCGCNPEPWALGVSPDGTLVVTTNSNRPIAVRTDGRAHTFAGVPVVHYESPPGFTWSRGRVLVSNRKGALGWEPPGGAIDAVSGTASKATEAFAFGAKLAVTLYRHHDNRVAVFVCNADGTGLKRLTAWMRDARLAGWSHDGRTIVYSSGGSVFAADPAGSAPVRIGPGRPRAVL